MQYYILGVVAGVILLNVLYADIIFWEKAGKLMKDEDKKKMIEGIVIVVTIIKIIVQHRGQIRKGR